MAPNAEDLLAALNRGISLLGDSYLLFSSFLLVVKEN